MEKGTEQRRHIFYRGSLKSCNYCCSYCPFSKGKESRSGIERDEAQWNRFVKYICRGSFSGAVQAVPYGEALIHRYYWEGLAALSRCGGIDAVGAQSNFSFQASEMLDVFERAGGVKEKMFLWGTFHPEMVSVDAFLRKCTELKKAGVSFCVGAVGVPENQELLRELRSGLDRSVYMWINRMDGMGRKYTPEEIRVFSQIDAYFPLELRGFSPDVSRCLPSILVEGDGNIRSCIQCHASLGNLYEEETVRFPDKKCTSKRCGCYLAYATRSDIPELDAFGPYPAFRVPQGGNPV